MKNKKAKDILCKRLICIFEQCDKEYATRTECKKCPYFVSNKNVDNALQVIKSLFKEDD